MLIEKSKVKPESGKILIEPYTIDEETEGGLIITKNESTGAPVVGRVLRTSDKSKYKEGQSVFFARYSADALTIDDEHGKITIYLVSEDEILATYDEKVESLPKKYEAIKEKKASKSNANSTKQKTEGKEGR